ncbi:hypothetical protein GH983_18325 [Agrobacterium sp. MA01]|jgi:hypothetical protein|uniref:hypothetical protein n=1 Tax=Agrobacterium sp. MA01 TaxID=2664893 RepID=UPI00129A436C|nr:hypothetical protein [Agrobacterium sp. MA01]QGG92305.1 hypothetical protein GH983_18325 [Agrobacterium sp. MA01]
MINYLWLFVVMLGPILLGAAVFYAIMRQRRLTGRERVNQDAATRELYEKDERADTGPYGGRR